MAPTLRLSTVGERLRGACCGCLPACSALVESPSNSKSLNNTGFGPCLDPYNLSFLRIPKFMSTNFCMPSRSG